MADPPAKPLIGWREWLLLPELCQHPVKVKVDTGACSSALHAVDLRLFREAEDDWVRFWFLPHQNDDRDQCEVCMRVFDFRQVRSSNGETSERPVIRTHFCWRDQTWPLDLTLIDRSPMQFRMLLGREAIQGRLLVDPSRSFLGGVPQR